MCRSLLWLQLLMKPVVAIIQKMDEYITMSCYKNKGGFILVHKSINIFGEELSSIWIRDF